MISTICGSFWGNCNLLFLTNSNNIHSPSGGKVFFSITYSIQFVTLRLIEIMKWFWASQLILLSFLQNKASQVSLSCLPKQSDARTLKDIGNQTTRKNWDKYLWWCCTEKIEAMVISFRIWNLANTRSLQQISSDSCSRYPPTFVKLDLNKFPKTTVWMQTPDSLHFID